MPDDDFGVMVGRDGRRGAGTRMIVVRADESVGEGSVVLLEPGAFGCERGEGRPRAIFRKRVLKADEIGGGYGRLCDRRAGERGQNQSAEKSARPTAPGQRVAV